MTLDRVNVAYRLLEIESLVMNSRAQIGLEHPEAVVVILLEARGKLVTLCEELFAVDGVTEIAIAGDVPPQPKRENT